MHAEVLDEPELEFGGGGRHIDPRFGIANYGPADLLAPDAPRAIRIGLIGPADQLAGLGTWFERCREPIAAKDERYPHLFPGFPGCDIDVGLHTTLVFSDRNTRAISDRALRAISDAPPSAALPRPSRPTRRRSSRSPRRTASTSCSSPAPSSWPTSHAAAGDARGALRQRAEPATKGCPGSRTSTICSRRGCYTCASRSRSSAAAPGTRRARPRPAQPPGRGQPRLEPARRAVLQGGGVPWRLLRNPPT